MRLRVLRLLAEALAVEIDHQHLTVAAGNPAPMPVALVGAIVLRGIMSSVKFRMGRRLGSSAMAADAWNDAVDILSALAALTAVGLATYDPARFLAADDYGGFVSKSWSSSPVSASYETRRLSS